MKQRMAGSYQKAVNRYLDKKESKGFQFIHKDEVAELQQDITEQDRLLKAADADNRQLAKELDQTERAYDQIYDQLREAKNKFSIDDNVFHTIEDVF